MLIKIAKPDWEKIAYQARNLRSLAKSLKVDAGVALGSMLGALTVHGRLSAIHCKRVGDSAWNGGRMIDLGLLGKRVVTNAGVAALVDDWDNDAKNITSFNFHDSGTDNTSESASDTALGNDAGPATRATGTKSQPSANIIQSVGTINYGGTLAIVEHGLFDDADQTEGTLWDRTVFSAINVLNGDAIQFTYAATFTAGS